MSSKATIKRYIAGSKIDELKAKFADEANFNEMIILCIDFITAQLLNTCTPHVVRMTKAPQFIFRTKPRYEDDPELFDFKLRFDALKVHNKLLLEILARAIKLLLRTLEPQLDNLIASLSISQPEAVEPEIAYRWNNPRGGTAYHNSLGFCCGQWKFDYNSESKTRSFDDIEAIKDHLKSRKICSPLISVTHIPGQMLEILKTTGGHAAQDPNSKVYILDLRKLKLLSPGMKTTKNLTIKVPSEEYYHYERNQAGLKGISSHHWLVPQWIPACCILGSVTVESFRTILSDNDINFSKSIPLSGR